MMPMTPVIRLGPVKFTPFSTFPPSLQARPTGSASSDSTVRPVIAAVVMPPGMTPMGPILGVVADAQAQAQAAAQCVRDSAPVSDDRPGRRWPQPAKRVHPESGPSESADSKKFKLPILFSHMMDMNIEMVGAKRTAAMLHCLSSFPAPMDVKKQMDMLTDLTSKVDSAEMTIRDALNNEIDLNFSQSVAPEDPTKMPSDKWLASLSQSRMMIDRKLSLLTQLNLLQEFLGNSQWVNAYVHSSQTNQLPRRHLRRCPMQAQAFIDWFKQPGNAFDTHSLKHNGWLKMDTFIDDCLHVVPSGKSFQWWSGAMVLWSLRPLTFQSMICVHLNLRRISVMDF